MRFPSAISAGDAASARRTPQPLHEKHANLGYASLTSCLKSSRRGQNPSICEELVLENSTLKILTWANAELYGGNHSHRAFQTHISAFFVHDIGFPRKRGRVGGLPNDDASTHFGGRTRGGRLTGWRAAGLRLAGRLAGDKLAVSGERANSGRRQPGRRKTVERGRLERGRPRPTPDTERTTERAPRLMPWCRARRRARRRLSPRNACRRLQPTR